MTRNKISGLALAFVLAPLLAACSSGGRDIETPQHEVVARLGDDIEIRRYPPRLAAETVADSDNAAFRRLFDYISGGNDGGGEIAMTAPVETGAGGTDGSGAEIAMTAPVETEAPSPDGGDGVRMRFFLPAGYALETAPKPTDPEVRLVEVGERTEAVLRYSGLALDGRAETRRTRLLAAVEASDWAAQGPAVSYYYDPPWTLPWNRTNEVSVPVQRR